MEHNELSEDNTLDATELDNVDTEQEQQPQGNKGVAKLLAQRNALKAENESLKKQQEEMKTFVESKFSEKERATERAEFTKSYGNDALNAVDEVLTKYPNLPYEDALKIADPKSFVQGKSISMQGNIPHRVTTDPTPAEMPMDDLKVAVTKDLSAIGL